MAQHSLGFVRRSQGPNVPDAGVIKWAGAGYFCGAGEGRQRSA